ncbi:glycosyltransferase family 4 protein [Leptospira sp. 201903071]|uniref:glycosyltransferase family 4 protein n=1 Tax=Leptospira ainazelensis TaxID=2810034 RepID=UPI001962851F|nr:glycosyltransferase family 1 protein [Leptospira ainazelensis]MBM9501983.1 glycosyltransferase family 4 protein [Leptospira ainazelensis]
MKIFYDHQIFSMQKFGGISRYFFEILIRLRKNKNAEIDHSVIYSFNEYLADKTLFSIEKPYTFQDWFPKLKFRGKYRIFLLLQFLGLLPDPEAKMEKEVIQKIKVSDFDIFHPTYYSPYFLESLQKTGKPFVLTVHDLIHEIYPEYFFDSKEVIQNKKSLINKAAGLIAISENTKNDLLKYYKLQESKVKVIYHGSSMKPEFIGEELSPAKVEYLLFIGNRSHYKNFSFFLKSISSLFQEFPKLRLYCVGGGSFQKDEMALIEELNLRERVEQFHFKNDQELAEYYRKALLFVFPSRYEGFGIPLLEAFSCGTAVACSNTSSLPEVAGDAAFYFDPDSEESIRTCIRVAILNPEERIKKIQNGNLQIQKFSWDKAASETFDFYRSILAG